MLDSVPGCLCCRIPRTARVIVRQLGFCYLDCPLHSRKQPRCQIPRLWPAVASQRCANVAANWFVARHPHGSCPAQRRLTSMPRGAASCRRWPWRRTRRRSIAPWKPLSRTRASGSTTSTQSPSPLGRASASVCGRVPTPTTDVASTKRSSGPAHAHDPVILCSVRRLVYPLPATTMLLSCPQTRRLCA